MRDGYYAMQAEDIGLRTGGNQPIKYPDFYKVDVTEIDVPGTIYQEEGVTIEVFEVDHGDIEPAYGYTITTSDGTTVFSGDTAYTEAVEAAAEGADILVHEVISEEGWSALSEDWREYHQSSHTLTSELARLAGKAQPGVLVLTHIASYGAPIETALSEVEARYEGRVVLADDLDVFELPLSE